MNPLSKRSIAIKLTLLYTLATFILLSIIASILYFTMENVLNASNRQFLTDEMDVLQSIVKENSLDKDALKQAVIDTPNAIRNSGYHYYIKVLDKERKPIMQTPGMEKIIQETDFFKTKSSSRVSQLYSKDDNDYLLMQTPVIMNKKKKETRWIQIVLDVTSQDEITDQYKRNFMYALGIELFFAILIGYFIARRSTSSLVDLAWITQQITANSLQKRIDPENWPRELRELGYAFNNMLIRIENAFVRLSQFSADLAHELRTPLHNLMIHSELALSSTSIDEYRKVLEANLEEYQRLSKTIENLLFLAQVENPQFHVDKTDVAAHTEINSICEFYQNLAEEKNIAITCEGKSIIQANPILFRRVISNLLSNAINYTPAGGKINFFIAEKNHKTEITITDSGMGIKSEDMSKIGGRFWRADKSNLFSKGTGLGIAIVKSIMELHGGSFSIQSQLNKGTNVVLVFSR